MISVVCGSLGSVRYMTTCRQCVRVCVRSGASKDLDGELIDIYRASTNRHRSEDLFIKVRHKPTTTTSTRLQLALACVHFTTTSASPIPLQANVPSGPPYTAPRNSPSDPPRWSATPRPTPR